MRLYAEIEDPAFHLFIKNEQKRRDDAHKLSVFHLLALYDVKQDRADKVDENIMEELMKEGLVVEENAKLRLGDVYREMQVRSRGGNPAIKDPIKDVLDEKDPINANLLGGDPSKKDPIKDVLDEKDLINANLLGGDPPKKDPINCNLNLVQNRVIGAIGEVGVINGVSLAKKLRHSINYLKRVLAYLSSGEVALIEHVGSNKSGGYQLTEKGLEVYRIIKGVIDNDKQKV